LLWPYLDHLAESLISYYKKNKIFLINLYDALLSIFKFVVIL